MSCHVCLLYGIDERATSRPLVVKINSDAYTNGERHLDGIVGKINSDGERHLDGIVGKINRDGERHLDGIVGKINSDVSWLVAMLEKHPFYCMSCDGVSANQIGS